MAKLQRLLHTRAALVGISVHGSNAAAWRGGGYAGEVASRPLMAGRPLQEQRPALALCKDACGAVECCLRPRRLCQPHALRDWGLDPAS